MLQIENLNYSTAQKPLFKNLNFTIQPGQCVGFIGQNGTGKSTLLKIIAGIINTQQSNILLHSIPLNKISRIERAKHISYLAQKIEIYQDITVYDLVLLGRYPFYTIFNKNISIDRSLIQDCLEKVNILHLQYHNISSLSGGELQRAMLARMLATQATFMLLDEPTTSLDIEQTLYFLELLQNLKKQQKGIIISIHDLTLAHQYCDFILCLSPKIENGYIFGKTNKIISNINIKRYFNVLVNTKLTPPFSLNT